MSARMLVLWCPDWPAVAAAMAGGVPAHIPAAVFAANRVVACSAVARSAGVRRGMRRRDAQSRCPELVVFGTDEGRDARLFEPVAAAVEELVVGVDVVRPGLVAVPVTGAAGYFASKTGRETMARHYIGPLSALPAEGPASVAVERMASDTPGDSEATPRRHDRGRAQDRERHSELELAELLIDQVSGRTGAECQIGVADGLFAATLAAHRSVLVDPGATADFLAPLGIHELDQPDADRAELVDLLRRLGLRTLGSFAALTERDVVSRFGSAGLLAHRLARGLSERPPHRRRPPPELVVTREIDPPLERVDAAAFLAKTLAEGFHAGLAAHGLACARLGIYAVTERGEELSRVWRCAEPLTPQGIADRVRWQFEGWLRTGGPTSGVSRLRLVPEETVEGRSLQLGLWRGGTPGLEDEHADKANRALVRVQGLLGPDSVFTAVLDGGRGPAERVRLVPWGDQRAATSPPEMPWPQRLPQPSPATVFARARPARVLDALGVDVEVLRRRQLTAPPHLVVLGAGEPRHVVGWAGPWHVDGRWGSAAGSQTRIQALLAGEPEIAVLLTRTAGRNPQWTVEGVYD